MSMDQRQRSGLLSILSIAYFTISTKVVHHFVLCQLYCHAWSIPSSAIQSAQDRRRFITSQIAIISSVPFINIGPSSQTNANPITTSQEEEAGAGSDQGGDVIFTSGYGKEEYTNSITASRDTNISPKEVYDSIQSSYLYYPIEQLRKRNDDRVPRAFDVGAGAGNL